MKTYILEIENMIDVEGSGDVVLYYSKGHHDSDVFIAEALKKHEIVIDPSDVIHKYMRWEMFNGPDGPIHIGEEYDTPGRGKFPITIVYSWKDLER